MIWTLAVHSAVCEFLSACYCYLYPGPGAGADGGEDAAPQGGGGIHHSRLPTQRPPGLSLPDQVYTN